MAQIRTQNGYLTPSKRVDRPLSAVPIHRHESQPLPSPLKGADADMTCVCVPTLWVPKIYILILSCHRFAWMYNICAKLNGRMF